MAFLCIFKVQALPPLPLAMPTQLRITNKKRLLCFLFCLSKAQQILQTSVCQHIVVIVFVGAGLAWLVLPACSIPEVAGLLPLLSPSNPPHAFPIYHFVLFRFFHFFVEQRARSHCGAAMLSALALCAALSMPISRAFRFVARTSHVQAHTHTHT